MSDTRILAAAMNTPYSTCPRCKGAGTMPPPDLPTGLKPSPCDTCKGRGWVDRIESDWFKMGQELRMFRMNVARLTLRKAATLLGCSPTRLSAMEQGSLDPSSELELLRDLVEASKP